MIEPAGYRVLIKPDQIEELDPHLKRAKAAGLIIQESSLDREQSGVDTGVVLSIGPDAFKDFKQPWCKVGDRIAYAKHAGKLIKQDQTQFLVINDEDVVAVIGE